MNRPTRELLAACLMAAVAMAALPARADSPPGAAAAIDEEALARRVAEQVMKQLKESGFLQQQIEIGIQDYVRKQREARTRAEAEQQEEANRLAQAVRPPAVPRDHVYGNPDARISLIEYSDFECPFCKRFHATPREAVEAYGGQVNWVYRHFPLEFHNPLATKEAEASECAAALGGNDAFWRYADAIYARTRSNGNGFPVEGLVPLAGELGLDRKGFEECLESGRFAARVKEDLDEGQAIGISGTPGTVIRDNRSGRARAVAGAVPLPQLRAEIDALLAAPQ